MNLSEQKGLAAREFNAFVNCDADGFADGFADVVVICHLIFNCRGAADSAVHHPNSGDAVAAAKTN